jgi:hypothetical protein
MRRIFILLSIIMSLSALPEAVIRAAEPAPPCVKSPEIIGACFVVHGRLMLTNGNPSVRIWRVGTKRMLGVLDADRNVFNDLTDLPSELRKLFPVNNPDRTVIFGDYTVCPLSVERPRWMQDVCIAHAENLVAKPR